MFVFFFGTEKMFQNLLRGITIIRATLENHKAKFTWHTRGFQSWMNKGRSSFFHIFWLPNYYGWRQTLIWKDIFPLKQSELDKTKQSLIFLTLPFLPVFSWVWSIALNNSAALGTDILKELGSVSLAAHREQDVSWGREVSWLPRSARYFRSSADDFYLSSSIYRAKKASQFWNLELAKGWGWGQNWP